MKLEIRPPRLLCPLLLPLVVLLDRPLPVLRPLHVLPPLLRVGFEAERLRELALLLQPSRLPRVQFRFCGFFDERGAVRE